jgi:hypothetical protein
MTAALLACGGGGGGAVDEKVALSGTIAKGIVSGAKVRVLTASATPVVLASGIVTKADGTYSVSLDRQSGPIVIEADLEGADIADELRPGVTYKGLAGEKIRAIVVAESATPTVNVTPFSDMAVDLVSKAGWDAKAVTDANTMVRQMLGNTDFLTASPTSGAMLTSLTSVQQLVNNNPGGLTAVLTQMRAAVEVSNNAVSIKPTLVAALDAACGNLTACSNAFETPAEPIVIGTGDRVNPVFALFEDLRNTLLAYSRKDETGELDLAGMRINDAVKAAARPIDDEMLGLLAMFTEADELYRGVKAGTREVRELVNSGDVYGRISTFNTSGEQTIRSFLPRYRCEVGVATFSNTAGVQDLASYVTNTDAVTKDSANVMNCYGYGTVGRLFPGADGVDSYWHGITFIPQQDGSYNYVHQLRKQQFDRTKEATSSRVRAMYGTLSVTRDASSDLTGFNLNGKLVPGFKGNTPTTYATLDRVDAAVAFNASNPSSTSVRVDIRGSLTLYKTGNVFASNVEIAPGSQLTVKTDVPISYSQQLYYSGSSCPAGSTNSNLSPAPNLLCNSTVNTTDEALSTLNLNVSVSAPGVKFEGMVSADTPMFDKSQTEYMPTKMGLQGKISEADGSGYRLLLDGKATVQLLDFVSHDAQLNTQVPAQLTFDGKVLLKDRPEMKLVLTAEQNAQDQKSLTGTFSWNSKALKIAAATNGSWTVSSDAGVRFTIPKGGSDSPQDVFYGDQKVGTVNFGKSRIEFIDGRFQQF